MKQKAIICLLLCLTFLFSGCDFNNIGNKKGEMWAPVEWSINNNTWEGNPFEVIAEVNFRHEESEEVRKTQMFYAGDSTWKFRFTGNRPGKWAFKTSSDDPELDGKSGSVIIEQHSDLKGFITSSGNKFARYFTADSLKAYLVNIYQREGKHFTFSKGFGDPDSIQAYIKLAKENGCTGLFAYMGNQWFQKGVLGYDQHNSVNPDIKTFEALDKMISMAHQEGLHVHFWKWGDESRKATPIGVGGINGTPDKRLQRYIAARLGPLPGWTMGYGFDLHEWVSEKQIREWVNYMHEHMGWNHLLWGRERYNEALDVQSYPLLGWMERNYSEELPRHKYNKHVNKVGQGPYIYKDAVKLMATDSTRPHFFEERFIYLRKPWFDMETTRRLFWHYTMAGGIGSWWGEGYPKPEQLRTHRAFWLDKDRFQLDLEIANHLSEEAYVLSNPTKTHIVFYKENCKQIKLDLSDVSNSKNAIAIDTKKPYKEIDLGTMNQNMQTWQAPYLSDWALAIGKF